MSAPTNISALSATPILTLPANITEDITSAGVAQTVWFSYTAVTGDQMLGWLAYADAGSAYRPKTSIWLGPASAPVAYPRIGFSSFDQPMTIPVDAGITYYLKVEPGAGSTNPPGANLVISALQNPTTIAPIGSLLVPDDGLVAKAAALDATTGTVLQYADMASGEEGDILPSGIVGLSNDDLGDPFAIVIYNTSLVETSTTLVNPNTIALCIRADSSKFFYSEWVTGSTTTLSTISAAGVIGGTTWTIPSFVATMAPNRAGTILYHATGIANGAIQRYDLAGNAPLSDLVAAPASHFADRDMFVLADGTILVCWSEPDTDFSIRRYDTSGTLLNTYPFTPLANRTLGPRMALGSDDPDSFWAWASSQPTGPTISKFVHIKISDGSTLASFNVPVFEDGLGAQGTGQQTNMTRFGNSQSCPLLVLRQPLGPPPTPSTTTTYPVRRLRQTAHLSDEQVWLFFSRFQLDCETGVGLNDGQGSDPQVMLQFSDDGGHTWSPERWASAGKQGKYKRRVIWRRLGRSRDRVWRITVSDPVAWRLLTAYIDVTKGTS